MESIGDSRLNFPCVTIIVVSTASALMSSLSVVRTLWIFFFFFSLVLVQILTLPAISEDHTENV